MDSKFPMVIILLLGFTMFVTNVNAEPSVSIKMEQNELGYCERLAYTIEVSEVTGEKATIVIRDPVGITSSGIDIPITNLQNYDKWRPPTTEQWPEGKYFIDVYYLDSKNTTEFVLTNLGYECPLEPARPIIDLWISGGISNEFMIDAIQREINKESNKLHIDINKNDDEDIVIPEWVRFVANWWSLGEISYEDFIEVLNYLNDKKIISPSQEIGNEI